ncbi:hypothetical protein LINGRAHAP2_LOCUS17971, partial [Linum grandiflorum]
MERTVYGHEGLPLWHCRGWLPHLVRLSDLVRPSTFMHSALRLYRKRSKSAVLTSPSRASSTGGWFFSGPPCSAVGSLTGTISAKK